MFRNGSATYPDAVQLLPCEARWCDPMSVNPLSGERYADQAHWRMYNILVNDSIPCWNNPGTYVGDAFREMSGVLDRPSPCYVDCSMADNASPGRIGANRTGIPQPYVCEANGHLSPVLSGAPLNCSSDICDRYHPSLEAPGVNRTDCLTASLSDPECTARCDRGYGDLRKANISDTDTPYLCHSNVTEGQYVTVPQSLLTGHPKYRSTSHPTNPASAAQIEHNFVQC